jgi:competence protein ComEA
LLFINFNYQPGPLVTTGESSVSGKINLILVDVGGGVATPGVYSLPLGSRVIDLIQAAGGLSEEADSISIGKL